MKIDSITIILAPNEKEIEQGYTKVALSRNEDKVWSTSDELQQFGLLPYQLKLAMALQEVIAEFNGNDPGLKS